MAQNGVSLGKTTQKGHTYWQLRWNDPTTGKRRSQNVGRVDKVGVRKARKARQRKELELEDCPALRRGNRTDTVKAWCDTFQKNKAAEGRKAATLKLYALAARLLVEYFGEARQIHEVTKADAMRFAASLRNNELDHVREPYKAGAKRDKPAETKRKPMSKATARKHLANCRTIFQAACDTFDQLKANPFSAVKLGRPPVKHDWHYVTADEFWKLYHAADEGLKVLLAVCRLAALRRGDAMKLRWSAVDLERNVLNVVQGKTDKPCRPPIQKELAAILNGLPRPMTIHDARVVPDDVCVDNIGRDFAVVCKRAGVEPYDQPLHALRKSCIDDWAKAGWPPNVVKEWAGHADIKTTMTFYAKVDQRDIDRAAGMSLFSSDSDVTSDVTATVDAAG